MADRMKLNEKNGVVDKQRENVAKTSSCKEISSYRDNIFILLNLLTDFGSELKLGEAALKISTSLEAVDVTSLQPTHHVFTCLQKHISKLQSVSDNLRVLLEAEGQSSSSKSNKDETITTVSSDEEMTIDSDPMLPAAQPTRPEVEEEGKLQVDDLSVQIRATKSEIDRRISAFIERKQLEINENNVREFCNVIDCNQEDSCARTDAVFTPYPGFKSHVKVLRVVNTYGPQTRGGGGVGGGALGEAEEQQRAMVSRDCGNPAIEERLHNIETHLKLPTEGPVPLSVYQRLKKLEDRILELEGLSPEYFQSSYLHKRPKTSMSQACSLSELDVKISAVKAALLKRMGEFGPVAYDTECPL
ncbi:MAP3K12-binding inhibitory protein 1 [Coregonus clupeaformis]|uniref:MAP3K12-binding inhibitory protein 1 n=1 Tax=Coregonus clupeaformis TaxID=59861 RepID=UPI001BE075A2|nr:MAP3K12-binding inhibitory protein 1 [Coregonus clupeaformis]